ncbi:uncharacterized protein [Prorops nasuta]|uniref:uncharacterized protein n=1 Tax=Prorops nasuta TaxID=863751 RepID=UPI0034CE747E
MIWQVVAKNPLFNGFNGKYPLSQFLKQCDYLKGFTTGTIPEWAKVELLSSVCSIRLQNEIKESGICTIDGLKEHMYKLFSFKNSILCLILSFGNIKFREGEDINNLEKRILVIIDQINDYFGDSMIESIKSFVEELAVETFWYAIEPKYRAKLIGPYKNLKEITDETRKIQATMDNINGGEVVFQEAYEDSFDKALGNSLEKRRRKRFLNECQFCENTGHNIKNCWLNPWISKSRLRSIECNSEESFTAPKNSNIKCRYCKKTGHLVKNCRKRIFNNNKNKTVESYFEKQNDGKYNCQGSLKYPNTRIERQGDSKKVDETCKSLKNLKNVFSSENNCPSSSKLCKLPYLLVHSKSLKKHKRKFLIDTGAQVNLIKLGALKNPNSINSNIIYTLGGISKHDKPQTLGVTTVYFNGVDCIFQVIPDDFPLKFAGIISASILNDQKSKIDFQKKKIILDDREYSLY